MPGKSFMPTHTAYTIKAQTGSAVPWPQWVGELILQVAVMTKIPTVTAQSLPPTHRKCSVAWQASSNGCGYTSQTTAQQNKSSSLFFVRLLIDSISSILLHRKSRYVISLQYIAYESKLNQVQSDSKEKNPWFTFHGISVNEMSFLTTYI